MHGNANVLDRIRQKAKKRAPTLETNPDNQKRKQLGLICLKTSKKIEEKFNVIDWPHPSICDLPRGGR
jgi:hypothetical protein